MSRILLSNVRHGGHERACVAADAAVCAGEQGRFWGFADEAFSRGVTEEALTSSAGAAGLDLMRWRQCRWSRRARDVVETDIADGQRLGVRSTPTFVIGDQVIPGLLSEDELVRQIRKQLGAREPAAGGEG